MHDSLIILKKNTSLQVLSTVGHLIFSILDLYFFKNLNFSENQAFWPLIKTFLLRDGLRSTDFNFSENQTFLNSFLCEYGSEQPPNYRWSQNKLKAVTLFFIAYLQGNQSERVNSKLFFEKKRKRLTKKWSSYLICSHFVPLFCLLLPEKFSRSILNACNRFFLPGKFLQFFRLDLNFFSLNLLIVYFLRKRDRWSWKSSHIWAHSF